MSMKNKTEDSEPLCVADPEALRPFLRRHEGRLAGLREAHHSVGKMRETQETRAANAKARLRVHLQRLGEQTALAIEALADGERLEAGAGSSTLVAYNAAELIPFVQRVEEAREELRRRQDLATAFSFAQGEIHSAMGTL